MQRPRCREPPFASPAGSSDFTKDFQLKAWKDMADSPGGADADPRVVATISQGESVSRLCWSDDFGVHPDRSVTGSRKLVYGELDQWTLQLHASTNCVRLLAHVSMHQLALEDL